MQSAIDNLVRPDTKAKSAIQLNGVSVRYQLLTEEARTLRGRLLSAISHGEKCAEFWATLQGVSLLSGQCAVPRIIGPNRIRQEHDAEESSRGSLNRRRGRSQRWGESLPFSILPARSIRSTAVVRMRLSLERCMGLRGRRSPAGFRRSSSTPALGPFIDVPLKAYSSGAWLPDWHTHYGRHSWSRIFCCSTKCCQMQRSSNSRESPISRVRKLIELEGNVVDADRLLTNVALLDINSAMPRDRAALGREDRGRWHAAASGR